MRNIVLPLPDLEALLSPLHILTMKEHKFELDIGLFKMLCIKNMTGNVSYKSLVTYAVGYNLRRFTVHNRVIQNTNIGYDVIDAHVIISMLAM